MGARAAMALVAARSSAFGLGSRPWLPSCSLVGSESAMPWFVGAPKLTLKALAERAAWDPTFGRSVCQGVAA